MSLDQLLGMSPGEAVICVLVAICASYLVWQLGTGDLADKEDLDG